MSESESQTTGRAERAFERGDYASCRAALRELDDGESELKRRLAPDPGTGVVAVIAAILGLILAIYYALQ